MTSGNTETDSGVGTAPPKASSKETPNVTTKAVKVLKRTREELEQRYLWWERVTAWPMFILSVAFVLITMVIIADPGHLSAEDRVHLTASMFFLWSLFLADFAVRFLLTPNHKTFLKTQSFDLISLLIPYLRPFLLIRYVWRLSVFRHGGAGLRDRVAISAMLFALFFTYTISTLVWVVERHAHGANILNWGDAIWWGFTTITTVGYGDFVPVTVTGRILAVLLMVGGLAMVGAVSGTIVSWFSEHISDYVQSHTDQEGLPVAPEDVDPAGKAIIEALSVGAVDNPALRAVAHESPAPSSATPNGGAAVASAADGSGAATEPTPATAAPTAAPDNATPDEPAADADPRGTP